MEIPHRGARPALPEIHVHDSPSFRSRSSFNSSASSSAIPMSIPNARESDWAPPPLPPPRHIPEIDGDGGHNGHDIAWEWGNSPSRSDWGRSTRSVPQSSSLYGSFMGGRSMIEERPDSSRRTSSTSTLKSLTRGESKENRYPSPRIDEGYASLSVKSNGSGLLVPSPNATNPPNLFSVKHTEQGKGSKYNDSSSLRSSGFQSSVHEGYRSNAQAFDKSLLQKLDARRGSDNKTPPRSYSKTSFSSSVNDASPTSYPESRYDRYANQLKPLSLPILPGRPGSGESPLSRWREGDTPSSSAISPGNPFPRFGGHGQYDHRSPSDAESERSPLPFTGRHGSSSGSIISMCDDTSSVTSRSRDGYDLRVSPDHDGDFPMEEAGLRRLQIDDSVSRQDGFSPGAITGQKRRASSPPMDEGPPLSGVGSSDLYRRRESGSRNSPGPSRFHTITGSMSSTGSERRSNSYSTLSIGGSSVTSMGSSVFGHLSPGGVSPIPTDGSDSPYFTSLSLNPSPRGSFSRTNHSRTLSDTRPLMNSRKLSDHGGHSKSNSTPKMQGVYICECCPKKPKKFDSQDELHAHEQEKQYECAYCPNRFKNKNEAERHQNSLHLRRHSWSCAALAGYAAAFHISPLRPNEADSCGYCGEDFPRTGIASPTSNGHQVFVATEQDWETRIGHLQEMHKFGECNHAKKFFRADHFRQHLKHSHAGTSGKWTNMLENACMKDEPLPEPIRGPGAVNSGAARVARIDANRINEEEEVI